MFLANPTVYGLSNLLIQGSTYKNNYINIEHEILEDVGVLSPSIPDGVITGHRESTDGDEVENDGENVFDVEPTHLILCSNCER